MTDTDQEGWFTDPFLLHEERWLSNGRPTKLVKDGGVESFDPPPDRPPTETPTRIEPDPDATEGSDMQRADGAGSVDPSAYALGAMDAVGQVGAPNLQRLYDGEDY